MCKESPSRPLAYGFRMVLACSLLLAGTAVWAQATRITLGPATTVTAGIQQLGSAQRKVVAAEVVEADVLRKTLPAGAYAPSQLIETLRERLAARGYAQDAGNLWFLTSVRSPTPNLRINSRFQQQQQQVSQVGKLLQSLTPEQREELQSERGGLAFQNLNGDQRAQVLGLLGNQEPFLVNNIPFTQNPDGKLKLEFRTWMYVRTPDNRLISVQVGDSAAPAPAANGEKGRGAKTPPEQIVPTKSPVGGAAGTPLRKMSIEEEFGGNFQIALPPRELPVYSLQELGELASRITGKELRVDRRAAQRQLAVVPVEGTLRAVELLRFMKNCTGLEWRKVDTLAFLGLYPEFAKQKAVQAATEGLKKSQESLAARVEEGFGGALPIPSETLFNTHQGWENLPRSQQAELLRLGSRAKVGGQDFRPFLADPRRLQGCSIRFGLDVSIRAEAPGGSFTRPIQLVP